MRPGPGWDGVVVSAVSWMFMFYVYTYIIKVADILEKAVGDSVEFKTAEGNAEAYKIASITAYNA